MSIRSPGRPLRGRFAPSPTGDLHLGSAATALLAWLSVRSRGGAFVLRVEDIDQPRVREGAKDRILEDLEWLGLDWDEGPYEQWSRLEHYAAAFERLRTSGFVYPCFCSRRDIASSASAPQAAGDEVRYPGTCRGLDTEAARRSAREGKARSWRIRMEGESGLDFVDGVQGARRIDPETSSDFVIQRGDGVPSYQLAVVVDDAAMGITEVVRGSDLIASTHRQLLLYRFLALEAPAFAHVPLLLGADGIRLSKRHQGTSIREAREAGRRPEDVIGDLARLLGLRPEAKPIPARELVEGFSFAIVRAAPEGILLPPRP